MHVPTNRVYISHDVVFDENVFPFHALPSKSTTSMPNVHSTIPSPYRFVDVANAPVLLPNHAAGIGRGARLELLDNEAMNNTHDGHDDPVHGPCMAGRARQPDASTAAPRVSAAPAAAPGSPGLPGRVT